ncbi:hypothetical protein C7M84_017385 [Penaeus vannamei]|uniref:RNA-directed DNA polymerase n=1 Tax=Penaeus vannamei TaxID=6689 RepID=A0A3R7QEA4_PENVA|nr:hypothetical protein C7M84_017385 [Penaeus vannamei]
MCPFGQCRPGQGSRPMGGEGTPGQACSAEVGGQANDHSDHQRVSEMTMVKDTVAALLPGIPMQDSSRTLQGVTGLPKAVTAEADLIFTIHPRSDVIHRTCVVNGLNFTGDLLGMELLQQLAFCLCFSAEPLAETAVVEPRSGRFLSATVSRFVPTNAHLALVEGSTSRLTVPRTLVAVHDRRSSVWVVNPYPKPRKVSPGTVIGYAEFLEPDEITPVGGDVAVLNTTPSNVDPLGDNDSPSEGEFLDDEFDNFDACLDFGYQDSEFFVFPDTPALDKAHQQDTSRMASAGGDTVTNQPAWTQLPLDHLTADQLEHHEPEPEPNPPDQPEDDPDLTTMDPRKMREQQIRDPTCNDLISWLEGHQALPQQRPPAIISSFEVEDGVLYHLREYSDRAVKQLYVPLHLQTQALHLAHCPPSATHPGALQTYQNLCNSWYFPNMLLQSREYVARCPVCQRRKGSAVRVPMQGHLPPEAPLVMVSADLMDLRSSSRGYQYVLSIIVTTPAFCSWSFFVTRQLKEFCQLSWITT